MNDSGTQTQVPSVLTRVAADMKFHIHIHIHRLYVDIREYIRIHRCLSYIYIYIYIYTLYPLNIHKAQLVFTFYYENVGKQRIKRL